MFIIIWEYQVKAGKRSEFEDTYSPNGAWAWLFKKSPEYLGTELLRSDKQHLCYLTIDRWSSKEDYEAFQVQWGNEYKALDVQCEDLTESRSLIGTWDSL